MDTLLDGSLTPEVGLVGSLHTSYTLHVQLFKELLDLTKVLNANMLTCTLYNVHVQCTLVVCTFESQQSNQSNTVRKRKCKNFSKLQSFRNILKCHGDPCPCGSTSAFLLLPHSGLCIWLSCKEESIFVILSYENLTLWLSWIERVMLVISPLVVEGEHFP